MKKIFSLIIIVLLFIAGCTFNKDSKNITIVTTNFPSYDFVRSIIKDSNIDLKLLLKPGTDIHDYEPSPKDIIDIKNSNMFIYVGGESDSWIDSIIDNIDNDTKVIKLMDLVSLKEEEIIDGMDAEEEEIEYDEHIWTSISNAISIINKLKDEIISIDSTNKSLYEKNSDIYINELKNIDSKIKEVVNTSKRDTLVFGDRFPFRYFVDEYNLKYYAAFPGCSDKTEASAKTIAFLIDKIKEDNIPVILKLELSNSKIADTLSKETNTKVLTFNSAHNVSLEEFNKGITYVDIMNSNIDVLKEALN